MGGQLGVMETAFALHILDEISAHLPITLVPFFRGESLLHPDWWSIIAYAHEKGIGPIQFTTNATLLDEENSRRLLACGVDFISFSLDTLDPALYESSRRGANYDTTMANILRFLDMRKKAHSRMTVQVSAVETERSRPGMDAFISFWRSRVSRVRVYPEHSCNGKPGSLRNCHDFPSPRRPCKKVLEDMVILWNGDVAICNHDWLRQGQGEVFANVSDGIGNAWNCGPYKRLRIAHEQNMLEGIYPCAGCDHWQAFYLPQQIIGRLYIGALA